MTESSTTILIRRAQKLHKELSNILKKLEAKGILLIGVNTKQEAK